MNGVERFWLGLLGGGPGDHPPPRSEAEWTALADRAFQHQLGALTYRQLEDASLGQAAPAAVVERLRAAYVQGAVRNALLFRDGARGVRMLGEAGIPTLLLKGLHLARFVYPEPGLRSMADLDLMVPMDRLADAERLFVAQGYGPTPRPHLAVFCAWSNHLAKLERPNSAVIELHWGIERPTSPFKIDRDGLWERARRAELDGAGVLLLAPEDLLLHLALHASYHHGFDRSPLKALVDVAVSLRHHGAEIDWPTLVARANAWGAGGFAYTTFRLARLVLNAAVPEAALDGLVHDGTDDEVVAVARRYILLPPPELPEPMVEVARRSGRDRWRLVLGAAFPARVTMERIYRLRPGSPLVYAWYVQRVVELIGRRGGPLIRALVPGAARHGALDRDAARRRIERWVKEREAGSLAP